MLQANKHTHYTQQPDTQITHTVLLKVKIRYLKRRRPHCSERYNTVTLSRRTGIPAHIKQHGRLGVLVVYDYHVVYTVHGEPARDTKLQGRHLIKYPVRKRQENYIKIFIIFSRAKLMAFLTF